MRMDLIVLSICVAWPMSELAMGAEPRDVAFVSQADGSEQRYVEWLPSDFKADETSDVLLVFHGHGADRWQFIRETRDECRGVRDVAARHGMIVIAPDYRARTSWMGPLAEADVLQIIRSIRQQYKVRKIFLSGGSMGGTAVLTFAALHPELVDGVCSLNGTANLVEYDNFQDAMEASFGGTKAEVPEEYRRRSAEFFPEKFTMPMACTTGSMDTVVPPQSVLRLVSAVRQFNGKVLSLHRDDGDHATDYADTCEAMEFILRNADQ